MSDSGEITLKEKIRCLQREIAMRKRVYPRWVESGRMSYEDSQREIETMRAILGDYQRADAGARAGQKDLWGRGT